MTDLTPIINAVIALLAAVVTAVLVPWIRSNTTEKQRKEFLEWVDIFVAAAQQLFDETQGEKKLEYVFDALRVKGYNVTLPETRNIIEASVLKLHNVLGV